MSHPEIPDELPVQRSRAVLTQRPAHRHPSPPSPAEPPWWDGAKAVLAAFTRQVLLRPARIGTLVVLGGMTAVVLVGAEGWWIVLGITLFQAAASTLTVMWIEIPARRQQRPVEHQWVHRFTPDLVPRPRQPRPDE